MPPGRFLTGLVDCCVADEDDGVGPHGGNDDDDDDDGDEDVSEEEEEEEVGLSYLMKEGIQVGDFI